MTRILFFIALLLIVPFGEANAQTAGCKDPAATNYDPGVIVNNGSCVYPPLVLTATQKTSLAAAFIENSGMVFWNDKLWMHNDGGGTAAVYDVDTATGAILRTIVVSNATNVDWEDMAQDDSYLYIGDFGNNGTGNRTDLKIYRISKADVLSSNTVTADLISFAYPEQTIGAPTSNNTDFDCEAMVVNKGKIYLFTKQWISQGTALYEIPALPGTYNASLISTQNIGGLITGADIDVAKNIIILTGYNTPLLNRFLYLVYDFTGNAFFGGNKRKLTVSGSRQTESIAFRNSEYIYIANENSFFGPQRLEFINLTNVLNPYLSLLPITQIDLTARAMNGYIELNWDIKPRQEFLKGEIQRKTKADGHYETLTFLTKSAGVHNDHVNLQGGNFYYRIKAVDRHHVESFGFEQNVRWLGSNGPSVHYGFGELRISLPASADVFHIRLIDMTGRALKTMSTAQRNASMNTSMNTGDLPTGIYQVYIERNNTLETMYRFYKN